MLIRGSMDLSTLSTLDPVQFFVIGDHGIVVDHQMDAMAVQHLTLDVVDDGVARQHILPHIHLHMDAGEPLTGAVVVYHQIVVAQHLVIGARAATMVR